MLACKLNALTPQGQMRRTMLFRRLREAVLGFHELPTGYDLTLDATGVARGEVEELVHFEQHCCPFLEYEVGERGKLITVRITGPDGTTDFLKSQFGWVHH